jgi:hypothetical protein
MCGLNGKSKGMTIGKEDWEKEYIGFDYCLQPGCFSGKGTFPKLRGEKR